MTVAEVGEIFETWTFATVSPEGGGGGVGVGDGVGLTCSIAGRKISTIRQITRTILACDYSAHGPVTWHDGKTKFQSRVTKARSNVCFTDGHVAYTRIYYDAGQGGPWTYNPPPTFGFDYVWYAP